MVITKDAEMLMFPCSQARSCNCFLYLVLTRFVCVFVLVNMDMMERNKYKTTWNNHSKLEILEDGLICPDR